MAIDQEEEEVVDMEEVTASSQQCTLPGRHRLLPTLVQLVVMEQEQLGMEELLQGDMVEELVVVTQEEDMELQELVKDQVVEICQASYRH